jgi:glycine/serine hydroxymethyltransferase
MEQPIVMHIGNTLMINTLTNMIADILENPHNESIINKIRQQSLELCAKFPVYTH